MTGFTPGPWIRYIGGPIMAYGSVDTVSCAVLIPVAVAKPTSDYDSDGRHFTLPGCSAANSILIAAAPDMLAVLKHVAAILEEGGDVRPGKVAHASILAVIRKAEGN